MRTAGSMINGATSFCCSALVLYSPPIASRYILEISAMFTARFCQKCHSTRPQRRLILPWKLYTFLHEKRVENNGICNHFNSRQLKTHRAPARVHLNAFTHTHTHTHTRAARCIVCERAAAATSPMTCTYSLA